MTVIHPNSISGITSVTSHSNSLYFYESDHSTKLTINAHVNGDITATSGTFSGNVSIAGTLTYEDVTNIDSVGIVTAQSGIQLDDSITHLGDTDTKIRFPANDTVTVETGGTEKLRIASSGQIGLGGANYGTSGQVITSNGSGSAPTWQDAGGGGGGGGLVYISTTTVSSTTAQVGFDLSSTDYDFFIVKAYGCKFTAAPGNGYCVYFNFYDGAYDSGNVGTNRMSVRYQSSRQDGSTFNTGTSWAYNLSLGLTWTPTTSANFSFNAEIGGKTNSPIYITSNFLEGTTTSSGCPTINGIAPNSSNNMTYMIVKPSTTTFASGTFLLYGIKNS